MGEPALKLVGYADNLPEIPVGGQWLSVNEAASRCGKNPGTVRRWCQNHWGPAGLARIQPSSTGPAWFIHESADPSLKGVQFVEDVNESFDMASVSAKQRDVILFRERCVLQVESLRREQFRLDMTIAELVDRVARSINGNPRELPLQPVSARSLERWYTSYFKGAPSGTGGIMRGRPALVDRRLDKPKVDDMEDYKPFFRLFDDWYLQQGQPSIRTCYKMAIVQAPREGVTVIPSLTTTQRYVASIPEDRITLARLGVKAHNDKCAAFIQRDYTRIMVPGDDGRPVERDFRADDIWNCDHHICDVIVRDGVDANGKPKFIRPWLTPWLDMRSRKIVGYRFSRQAPDSSTVLLAFRDAAYRAGMAVPRWVYIDNGKDFDAWFLQGQTKVERRRKIIHDPTAFNGIFGMLQIGVTHAKPYNAQAKPIERFFGTFEDQFGRLQMTYCGRDPQHKPERLADVLKTKRVPTFEEFVNEASAWIEDVYHVNRHEGHGMDGHSPAEVYDATRHTIRAVSEASLAVCLVKVTELKTVKLRGIEYGRTLYGVGDPALSALRGEKVHLFIDPEDVRQVRVFSRDLKYLCTIASQELQPHSIVSHDSLRAATARMNRINGETKRTLKRSLRIVHSPGELLAQEALERARAHEPIPDPDGPATVEMVRTGFEQALMPVQPLLQNAVGAEVVPPRRSRLAAFAEDGEL